MPPQPLAQQLPRLLRGGTIVAESCIKPRTLSLHPCTLRHQCVELSLDIPFHVLRGLPPQPRSGAGRGKQIVSTVLDVNGVSLVVVVGKVMSSEASGSKASAEEPWLSVFVCSPDKSDVVLGADGATVVRIALSASSPQPSDGSDQLQVHQAAAGSSSTVPSGDFLDGFDTTLSTSAISEKYWDRRVCLYVECHAAPTDASALEPKRGLSPQPLPAPPVANVKLKKITESSVGYFKRFAGFSQFLTMGDVLATCVNTTSARSSGGIELEGEGGVARDAFVTIVVKVAIGHSHEQMNKAFGLAASQARMEYNLIGLRNHGSTCYLNVLLQCLFHISPFRREVYEMGLRGTQSSSGSSGGGVAGRKLAMSAAQLQRIFYGLETSDTPVETLELLRSIHVNPSIQSDAHEFLSEFFLHRVFKSVTDLFTVRVKYITRCNDVAFTSTSEENLFELSLCVGPKLGSLEAALEKELSLEPISDLYDTGLAQFGKQQASRQMHIVGFPPIVFIHSKRFDHFSRKLHHAQSFPMELALAQDQRYALHSLVVHHGTGINQGHFTAYVRIAQGGGSGSYQFFHFDDEAVTPVADEDVLRELTGIWWSGPSSSAFMYVYIRLDMYSDMTSKFDPVPPTTEQMVRKMNAAAPPSSGGGRRTPPPPQQSDRRGSTTSSAPATPQQQGAMTSPTMAPASKPATSGGFRDFNDVTRVMQSVRQTIALPLAGDKRYPQLVRICFWTVLGYRSVCSTIRADSHTLDLRFLTKYLRQDKWFNHGGGSDEDTGDDGVSFLHGSDRGALDVVAPIESSLETVLATVVRLLIRERRCDATWQERQLQPPRGDGSKPYEAMLFTQRVNGSFRPTTPIFPFVDDEYATPQDGDLAPDLRSPTAASTISGLSTVKRLELPPECLVERPIPPTAEASCPTTLKDVIAASGVDVNFNICNEAIELHVMLTAKSPTAHRRQMFATSAAVAESDGGGSSDAGHSTSMTGSLVYNCRDSAMLYFKRFTPSSVSSVLLESQPKGEFSFIGGFYVPLTWSIADLVANMSRAGLFGPIKAGGGGTTDNLMRSTVLFEEVRFERVDRIFATALRDDADRTVRELGLDHGDVVIFVAPTSPSSPSPHLSAAGGGLQIDVGPFGAFSPPATKEWSSTKDLPLADRIDHDLLMERRRRSTATYIDVCGDVPAFGHEEESGDAQKSTLVPDAGEKQSDGADSPRHVGHISVHIPRDDDSLSGEGGAFSPKEHFGDNDQTASAATTAPPTPSAMRPLTLPVAIADDAPTSAVVELESVDKAVDRIESLHCAVSAALLEGSARVVVALQMLLPVEPSEKSWAARSTQANETYFVLANLRDDSFDDFHKRCVDVLESVCNAKLGEVDAVEGEMDEGGKTNRGRKKLCLKMWPTGFQLEDLPTVASCGVDRFRCRQISEQFNQFLNAADVAVVGTSRSAASVMSLVYPSDLSLLLQLVCIRAVEPSEAAANSIVQPPAGGSALFLLDDSVVLNATLNNGTAEQQHASSKVPNMVPTFSVANAAMPLALCSTFRLLVEPQLRKFSSDDDKNGSADRSPEVQVLCRWMGWARSRPITILHQTTSVSSRIGVLIALLARRVGHGRPFSLSCVPSAMPSARCAHSFSFWGELFFHVLNVRSGFIETVALASELAKSDHPARTVEWWLQFVTPPLTESGVDADGGRGTSKGPSLVLSMGLLPNADRNVLSALRHTSSTSSSGTAGAAKVASPSASPANALRFLIVYHVATLTRGGNIDDTRVVARPCLISASDGRASIYGWLRHFYPGNDDAVDQWKVLIEVVPARAGDELSSSLDSRIVLLHALPRSRVLRSVGDVDRADRPSPLLLGGAFIPLASITTDDDYIALLRAPAAAQSLNRGAQSLLHIPAPARLVIVHEASDVARLNLS